MADADQNQPVAGDASALPSPASADAVSRLFQEHNRALVAYLAARLGSGQEAREVAQEAYVRLLQLQNPGAPSLLRAYLFKTATNLAIDRLRHRSVRDRSGGNLELFEELTSRHDECIDPAEQLLSLERAERLLDCLQELPVKCRQVLELHRLQGVSQHEVGARLGVSGRMVRRYLSYAMVYCQLRLDGMPAEEVRRRLSL